MSEIPTDKDNFLRFVCFFTDVGTDIVLKVFYYFQLRNPSIVSFPIPRTAPISKQLQNAFVKSQYYNVTNATSPDDFDINTLITLLRTLFSGVLPTPSNGWGRRPTSGDHSISADLLRLRSIRNDIVAHTNRANLSSTDFDKLWKTVEEILKRLVQTVDPGNEEKLEETFESYRQKTIGASTAEKYFDVLKKQLEDLKQTLKDFILLWKDKQQTPFVRYIKMLEDGGRSLLTAYLDKLIKENNVSLHKTLLEKQEIVLEELNGNGAMIEQVYPMSEENVKTVNTDTTSWDLSVIACLIESIFTTFVDEDDLDAIRAVRKARENYAYTALHAITSDEPFHCEREDLMVNLALLAKSIGGDSKQEFKRIKDEYRSPTFEMTSEEVEKYVYQLKWPGLDIQDFNDIHKESVEKIRSELSTAGKIDVNVKENFELEIMIQIACQDIEKQNEAEATLFNYIQAIVMNPGSETKEDLDFPEVKRTIETIRDIPTVRLTCVKKSCLLITVESNSSQAVISLVDYIDSSKFQNQLHDISIELMDNFDEVFILKGHFTLDSIQQIFVRMEGKLTENNRVKHDDAQTTEIFDTCMPCGIIDKQTQTWQGTESEWTNCLSNGDVEKAYQLLEKGQLPDATNLDRACQTFGLKSSLLKNICTKIENNIKALSDCIIYTEACYKETDRGKIVFVVITRRATDYVDLSKEKYNVNFRSIDYCSHEGRMIVDKERGLRFEDSELEALEIVLKDESPDLMEKHSNLTLTTGTMFESHYQGPKELSIEKKVCIAFYVTVKGLIPVGEDMLPNKLGQFDTDVREGRFYLAVGGQPGAKHKNLKLGCQISCEKVGTIGGFVEHPQHGICALTCAHVVLSDKEAIDILKKTNKSRDICIEKECYQPENRNNVDNKCGKVVEVQMINGDSNIAGVDAALVKIDDDRLPTNGHFPDCDLSDIKGGCSHCKDDIVRKTPSFKKGTVLDTDEITVNNKVVKYGQTTKFTIGMLKIKGGSVKLETITPEGYNLTLHNLMEIHSMDPPFSETGDSGALVFTQDDNSKLAAIGLLVGVNKNTNVSIVQPICSVLERVGCKRPFSLLNFDPHERRIDQLEKKMCRLESIHTSLDKISKKLDIL